MPNTTSTSWHQTLEEWAQQRFESWQKVPHVRPVAFAPFEAHRPEAFQALPVIMVILSRRTRAFHRELVQAIDLIRISTAAFRPVLFTDSAHSPAITACDWVIEQCLPEDLTESGVNWLDDASDHLSWTQRFFGATYIFAPKNTQEAEDLINGLALAYNAEPGVRAAAARIFAAAPNHFEELGCSSRGAWDQLPTGKREQNFTSDCGEVIQAVLNHVPESPGVFIGGIDAMTDSIDKLAASTGWSSITTTTATAASSRFAAAVINAGAQAMSPGGMRILVGADDPGISTDAVLTPTASGENHSLRIGNRTLRFAASETLRVLVTVASLLRR